MVTKDQVIGTVWKMFDLLPDPIQGAQKMSMDIFAKQCFLSYHEWIKWNAHDNRLSIMTIEERFDAFFAACHQTNPK